MFSTLKNIFRSLISNENNNPINNDVAIVKPSEFEIKVEYYGTGWHEYYCVKYFNGWLWCKMYDPIKPDEFEGKLFHPDNRTQPFLNTFDKCVEFASKFKTLQDVEDYHKKVHAKWDAEAKIINDRITERKNNRRTWSSKSSQ